VRDVKTSEIKMVSGSSGGKGSRLPFNENITLFTLRPGKSIKISNIIIHSAIGAGDGDGMHVLAVNAASVAVDQTPINPYDPEAGGISSRVANPTVYNISFTTNGSMQARTIVSTTCDNLIARVESLRELLSYGIERNGDEYILRIPGEGDTIGNLLMRTCNDLFPDIGAVTYWSPPIENYCDVRVRCDEDISTVYKTAIDHLVRVFGEIKQFF
jgi:DNA-directed RNA polymerase subunit L